MEPGESPEEALVRELDEELGVTVGLDLGEPLARIVNPDAPDGGLDIAIWAVTAWQGEIVNRAPQEHDDLRWFTREQIPTLDLAHPRLPGLLDRALRPTAG